MTTHLPKRLFGPSSAQPECPLSTQTCHYGLMAALPIADISRMRNAAPVTTFERFRTFLARTAVLWLVAAIALADLGAALGGPELPFYLLAVVVVIFAIIVGSRRALPRLLCSTEQLGFARNRDWLHYTIELKGTPRGYLPLAVLWFVGAVLTGLHFPYVGVVLASGLLLAAWAGDRRKYPVDLAATP